MKRSEKSVIDLQKHIIKPTYTFPKERANARDPKTKKLCIYLSIGFNNLYVPVNEPITLPDDYWSLLKDIGYISNEYLNDIIFDPVRNAK